ncbi:MAG TPA: DUF3147 family protein [Methylophilus sp.]
MFYLVVKYSVTALVVVVISELAKRNPQLGGLVAALPLVSVLALIWMQLEQQSVVKIASQASYTFWYVLPTLPMFLMLPYAMQKLGFWLGLLASIAFTIALFYGFALFLKQFNIDLL